MFASDHEEDDFGRPVASIDKEERSSFLRNKTLTFDELMMLSTDESDDNLMEVSGDSEEDVSLPSDEGPLPASQRRNISLEELLMLSSDDEDFDGVNNATEQGSRTRTPEFSEHYEEEDQYDHCRFNDSYDCDGAEMSNDNSEFEDDEAETGQSPSFR